MRCILALILAAAPALAQNYEKRVMVDPDYVPSMSKEEIDGVLREGDWKARRAERRAYELELAQARAAEAAAHAYAYEPYGYDVYEPSYSYAYASYTPTWSHYRPHDRRHYRHHYRHHYGHHRYRYRYYPAYGYGVSYHRDYRRGTFPTFTVLGGIAGGIIGHQSRETGAGIALGAGLGLLTDAILGAR